MAREHIDSLKSLRDHLVGDRRNLVATMLSDPATTTVTAEEFMGLQHFIDTVEMAISHEISLDQPQPGGFGNMNSSYRITPR